MVGVAVGVTVGVAVAQIQLLSEVQEVFLQTLVVPTAVQLMPVGQSEELTVSVQVLPQLGGVVGVGVGVAVAVAVGVAVAQIQLLSAVQEVFLQTLEAPTVVQVIPVGQSEELVVSVQVVPQLGGVVGVGVGVDMLKLTVQAELAAPGLLVGAFGATA